MPVNELKRFFKRAPGRASGFSLIEMLVVIAFIAILAFMVSPAMGSLVPKYHLRSSAKSVNALMQQARMNAANTGRPTRAVVDCRDHINDSSKPCRTTLYAAVFKDTGELDSWAILPGGRNDIPVSVYIAPLAGATKVASSADHLYWTVFMPAGHVKASHSPVGMVFSSSASGSSGTWNLAISQSSGRSTLTK